MRKVKKEKKAKSQTMAIVTITWELPIGDAKALREIYMGKRKARKARGK